MMTHANLLLMVIDDGFVDADGVVMTMIAFMVCIDMRSLYIVGLAKMVPLLMVTISLMLMLVLMFMLLMLHKVYADYDDYGGEASGHADAAVVGSADVVDAYSADGALGCCCG